MSRESADKPTRMRGAERRVLILARASKLFAEQGYAQASIGDLARASGVTEPMLYKHFGSKRQLFLAVLEDVSQRFMERFRTLVAAKAARSVGEALATLVLDYRAAALAEPDTVRVLLHTMRGSSDPEMMQGAIGHVQEVYALVHDLLTKAQQQGLVPPHLNLVAAAWGYLSFAAGVQYRVQTNTTEQFNIAVLEEMNRLWWQSLQIG